MRRTKTKKLLFVSLCLTIILSSLCGCQWQDKSEEHYFGFKVYESGYYKYLILDEVCPTCKDNFEGPHIVLWGLTEEGEKQEILMIPETINGYEVKHLGLRSVFNGRLDGHLFSQNVRRVYMPKYIESFSYAGFFYYHSYSEKATLNLERVVCNYLSNDGTYGGGYKYNYENVEVEYFEKENVSYWVTTGSTTPYWLDDYDYGEKITYIPEYPTRDGYEFVGWFKEEECLNKWDFENDTLPQEEKDENGEVIYQETKLFAKWEICSETDS